jgi:endonuclease/exonuclease/phosphatase (EEP) superfamily protein YafD
VSDRPRGAQRARRLCSLSLAVALGAASLVVASARWWWVGELAASFRWHLGWLALCCGAVLFAMRTWRTACFALLLGVWHVAPELELSFGSPPSAAREHSLEIVAANVLWPNRRIGEIAEVLRAADPTLIAFEELSPASLAELEGALAAWPERVVSPPREMWSDGTWGIGLFSKIPLRQVRRVPVGDSYAPLIEARVGLDGHELTIRVVHAPRPGRLHHLERDLRWDGGCILVGDLNTTSTSPAFDRLIERTGLRDSRRGFGREPTWTLRKLGLSLSIAIDHVLVGADLAVVERETLALPGSDHHAVRARLAWR